jgi:hypothetical protein
MHLRLIGDEAETRKIAWSTLEALVPGTRSRHMYRIVLRKVITVTIFRVIDHHNCLDKLQRSVCNCGCPDSNALPGQSRSVTYVI